MASESNNETEIGDGLSENASYKEDTNLACSSNSVNGIFASAKESFESASRLLRRKIPRTGHLMTPRRLWINTVPTQECDVVIMFPPKSEDMELMWMLSRLRCGTPGLVVQVKHHTSTDSYALYLTAPFSVLLKTAEELHLPKRLKEEHGGGLKEFVQLEIELFESGEEVDKDFFTTQERQWMVYHLLHTLRATTNDQFVPKCLSEGLISQMYPLHELDGLEQLRQNWVRTFVKKQPLDSVCKYFGVKIAMYFAWLGHYTYMLIIPAFVGFIFWIGFGRGDQSSEDIGYVLFSLFNVVWFSIYLEAWKRYSSELAYKWGTLDQRHELLMEPRPLYSGNLVVSPVTGRLEPTYPSWKRHVFRYFVSVPIIALCLLVVLSVMIASLKVQDWWDKYIQNGGYYFWLSYVPKVLLAVIITLLDEAYYKVALWLNDMENYRLDTKYENQLIVKVALFQFVNSFSSLFYIAFYLQDQERLKEQLATLLITRQLIGNIKESALPYVQEQFRLAKLSFDLYGALSPSEAKKSDGTTNDFDSASNGKPSSGGGNRNVSQAELESTLLKYEGTFADHLEMFIQLGYVVLFSCAFPLAALCALLNNLIEIRSDAFKLCFIFQRPFGQRIPNIGMWQNGMEVMSLVSVLVNCALIGLSGQVHRMFPEMSRTQTILLIVALEHIMFAVRFIISCVIPDLPDWVATEMAKVEFARREALSRISSTAVTPGLADNGGTGGTSVHHVASNTSVGRFTISPLPADSIDPNDIPLLPHEREELIIFCAEEKPEHQPDTKPNEESVLSQEPETLSESCPKPDKESVLSQKPDNKPSLSSSPPKSVDPSSSSPKLSKPKHINLNHMTISHGMEWMRRFKLDPMARR
ncbi:hypothetical protein M8J75_007605, partial [Diaphorina citri]